MYVSSAQAGRLMVAAADGAVRVWRDYTYRGSQRLATAWQVRSTGDGVTLSHRLNLLSRMSGRALLSRASSGRSCMPLMA